MSNAHIFRLSAFRHRPACPRDINNSDSAALLIENAPARLQKLYLFRMSRKKGFAKENKMEKKKEKWLLVVFERITHLIVGLVSFATLAASVVIAFEINKYVESLRVDEFTMFVLHVIEGAYLLFDAFVILRYIARKIIEAFNEDDEDI
jgi:hypothetical protein